jgi:hypothetical protein
LVIFGVFFGGFGPLSSLVFEKHEKVKKTRKNTKKTTFLSKSSSTPWNRPKKVQKSEVFRVFSCFLVIFWPLFWCYRALKVFFQFFKKVRFFDSWHGREKKDP